MPQRNFNKLKIKTKQTEKDEAKREHNEIAKAKKCFKMLKELRKRNAAIQAEKERRRQFWLENQAILFATGRASPASPVAAPTVRSTMERHV